MIWVDDADQRQQHLDHHGDEHDDAGDLDRHRDRHQHHVDEHHGRHDHVDHHAHDRGADRSVSGWNASRSPGIPLMAFTWFGSLPMIGSISLGPPRRHDLDHHRRQRNETTPIVIFLAVALTAHLETPSAPAIPPLTPNMAGAISCANGAVTGRAGMIPRAEECLRKAKEAEAMAEAARNQEAREIYTEVAKQWRTLADQVEKRGS